MSLLFLCISVLGGPLVSLVDLSKENPPLSSPEIPDNTWLRGDTGLQLRHRTQIRILLRLPPQKRKWLSALHNSILKTLLPDHIRLRVTRKSDVMESGDIFWRRKAVMHILLCILYCSGLECVFFWKKGFMGLRNYEVFFLSKTLCFLIFQELIIFYPLMGWRLSAKYGIFFYYMKVNQQ